MELTLDQALQKGIEAHKAGKAQKADQYYTAILKANPKHADANHNMGVLAVGVGKVEEALPFFKTALEANSSIAQYWLSYIDALIKLDRMADAKAVFDQAKSKGIKQDDFDLIELRLKTSSMDIKNEIQEDIPTHPSILDELKLDQALKLAKNKVKDGLSEEAKKIYQEILKKFPKNKKAIDGIKALAGKTLASTTDIQKPDSNKLQSLVDLSSKGQYQQTLIEASQLLRQFSNSATLYNIIGATNQSLGRSKAAIEACKKALSLNPNYAAAHNNMGNALKANGKLEEAIGAYAKAILLTPDNALAHYNMGNALHGFIFKNTIIGTQKSICSLLDKKIFVRPRAISEAAISLLKFDPCLQEQLKFADSDEVLENYLDIISNLNKIPLLLKLMSVCPLPDLKLEKLFKNLRKSMLLNISSLKEASSELLSFQSALALQCFTNEYVYNRSREEEKIIKFLETSVRKDLEKNDQPSPQVTLILASYKALNEYEWSKMLIVTDHIKEIITRGVIEPNTEKKLKIDLPVLEEIANNVSLKVREQYEESPYPRWVNLRLNLKPMSIANVVDEIKLKLHDNKIEEVEKPEILIAGCGTGQHSIETATRFKSSKLLAIDLSLSSLAYAKRKTEEFAIKNIEHMQADILGLGQLNKQFDIIESAGVLHHMDNPIAGWQVLADCLKPGGLMKIGLYSELARQHIVEIRQEIMDLSIGSDKAEIRSFRDMIMKSDKDHHKRVLRLHDFYSLSELRDLLFHIQEHRFTIPQIKGHLDKLGLKFCGFEGDKVVSHFTQTNIAKEDLYDLDKWQEYEKARPQAFAGMYQFWCQKIE